MKIDKNVFAKNLRNARRRLQITQNELEERVPNGFKRNYCSLFERKVHTPNTEQLAAINAFFGFDLSLASSILSEETHEFVPPPISDSTINTSGQEPFLPSGVSTEMAAFLKTRFVEILSSCTFIAEAQLDKEESGQENI